MKFLKDYVKCVKQNKVTLLGYCMMPVHLACNYLESKTQVPWMEVASTITYGASVFPLCVTMFGIETYTSFLRTKKHIEGNDGEVDKRFAQRCSKGMYCNKSGFWAAVKDEGLEEKVKDMLI